MSILPDYFFRGVVATFVSRLPPQETAAQLAAATHRSFLLPLFRQCVVGRVSVSRVVLYRHRPFLRNSFTPFFRGRFLVQATGSVLEGRFVVHWFVKVFLLFWYGLLAYSAIGASDPLGLRVRDLSDALSFALMMLGFAFFPVLLVTIGLVFGKSDAEYISRVIDKSIGDGSA